MDFRAYINERIAVGDMLADPQQVVLIDALSRLTDELPAYEQKTTGWRGKFIRPGKSTEVPRGIYAWGGVGRGKTFLMNAFYDVVPTQLKWRIHFHRFMLWVHEQNSKLANEQDPLKHIAKQVSARNRLLCLDEFMVTDIADAMILYQLLKHLYQQGVVIVTTSNIEPDGLYHNGIQRDLFLPAIELIKQHSEVVEISGDSDFRRQAWAYDAVYFSPLGEKADAGMAHCHAELTGYPEPRPASLMVAGRQIEAISVADDVAWFDFEGLCQTYRSQKDYIELSNRFNTLIVSGVPELGPDDDAAARRFINFIDTVYDHGVKLLVSAATPPEGIYTGSHLAHPFKRTASRLWEMSTPEYLQRPEKTA
jgi:cell division protein ZapE